MTFTRLTLALAATALASAAHAQTRYTASLLSAPASPKTIVDLSPGGAVLGSIRTSTAPEVEKSYVLGADGQLVFQVPDVRHTEARAMSRAGHVAGALYRKDLFAGGGYLRHPDGRLETFAVDGAYETSVQDVNASGTVVGTSKAGGPPRPTGFAWRDGVLTSLPSPYMADGESEVNAINDAGDMVGTASYTDFEHHATLWHADGSAVKLFDLPRHGSCTATAIASNGLVAGYCANSSTFAGAALWRSMAEAPQALAPLAGDADTFAYAINAAGVVVGESTTKEGIPHAIVWYDGVPADLQALVDLPAGTRLQSAWAVADDGRILAMARRDDGFYALLLTPAGR